MTEQTQGVRENPDGSLTIDLCIPIERPNERLTAIRLRRPTALQISKLNIERLKAGEQDGLIDFIYGLSELTLKEVEGMDGADFMFVSAEAVRVFLRRRTRQLA